MRAIDAGILICTECHELNRQDKDVDEQTCTRCGACIPVCPMHCIVNFYERNMEDVALVTAQAELNNIEIP